MHEQIVPAGGESTREFRQCGTCALVFVPPRYHLGRAEERAVYDQHVNSPEDAGYRTFLSRLSEPMLARLAPHSHGLDFGCGPGPALAGLFREAGHTCAEYDPFYRRDPSVLARSYDFVASSEVFEHLARPHDVLDLLLALLRPGGWLGIMTKRVTSREAFTTWHYVRDPTHVAFFSERTFAWVAARFGCTMHVHSADVVLLQAPGH
jgi:SAM-dependent methyltransferase